MALYLAEDFSPGLETKTWDKARESEVDLLNTTPVPGEGAGTRG